MDLSLSQISIRKKTKNRFPQPTINRFRRIDTALKALWLAFPEHFTVLKKLDTRLRFSTFEFFLYMKTPLVKNSKCPKHHFLAIFRPFWPKNRTPTGYCMCSGWIFTFGYSRKKFPKFSLWSSLRHSIRKNIKNHFPQPTIDRFRRIDTALKALWLAFPELFTNLKKLDTWLRFSTFEFLP